MPISERTISALAKVITGDSDISPYRSGPKLVTFFNELGANDVYGGGFPSRWYYAEEKIRELNESGSAAKAIESALDPRDFVHTAFTVDAAAQYLNEYLKYDGLVVVRHGDLWRVRNLSGGLVELDASTESSAIISHVFIEDQIRKCSDKVFEGDYAGAITNARSLIEAVLRALEAQLHPAPPEYDGDLPKLWRRVRKRMNLDAGDKVSDALRQMLGGLTSVVIGLAILRNQMGDAHAPTHVATRAHAVLAVNAAKTLTNYLVSVFVEANQSLKGRDLENTGNEVLVQ